MPQCLIALQCLTNITMFNQCHNVTLTDSYCTIHVKISPPCHSERSGTDIENQAIKSKNAAESNPEGAPAGGISALVYGRTSKRTPPTNRARSRPLQSPRTSQSTKNFPARQPPPSKRRKSSPTIPAVAVQGSSGRVMEVWRVGRPLRKGSPCASKVFITSSSDQTGTSCIRGGRGCSDQRTSAR